MNTTTITVLIGIASSLFGALTMLFTLRPKLRLAKEEANQSELKTHDIEVDLTEKIMVKYRELRLEVITLIEEGTAREAKFREMEANFRELAISENTHKKKLEEINLSIEAAKAHCTCGAWK